LAIVTDVDAEGAAGLAVAKANRAIGGVIINTANSGAIGGSVLQGDGPVTAIGADDGDGSIAAAFVDEIVGRDEGQGADFIIVIDDREGGDGPAESAAQSNVFAAEIEMVDGAGIGELEQSAAIALSDGIIKDTDDALAGSITKPISTVHISRNGIGAEQAITMNAALSTRDAGE